jgi:hypothetical protein
MKRVSILLCLTAPLIALLAFKIKQDENDLKNFVKKVKFKWGETCSQCTNNADTFTVYYVNTSPKNLDIMIGVREETPKSWRLATFYGVSKNDTLRCYACKGTGGSLVWAREAGDKSYAFPTQQEVDSTYTGKKK